MKHRLTLYCDKSQLADLRNFLSGVLKDKPISDTTKFEVILAVEEVCANLIIHSHGCNSKDKITLQVQEIDDKLIFEIKDSGKSFNLLEYQAPLLGDVIREKRKGGLGIMLVKKIMDKIEFESNGKDNTCRLIKIMDSK
ncbi:ATP-binding protein [Pararhodonellum marinum]|uniref:ATP-binding protein n=1 Tax=Pararhodonellum marinum TaxID=2755358 RepID=UPI00188FCC2D|nr:ATP-binding protein [Pararhodonellum marinum]